MDFHDFLRFLGKSERASHPPLKVRCRPAAVRRRGATEHIFVPTLSSTNCGATCDENLPALHSAASHFTVAEGSKPGPVSHGGATAAHNYAHRASERFLDFTPPPVASRRPASEERRLQARPRLTRRRGPQSRAPRSGAAGRAHLRAPLSRPSGVTHPAAATRSSCRVPY